MAKIRTVMGDVDPEEVGITLIHEHPYNLNFDIQLNELILFREQGGSCVVDQTTIVGRRPDLLKRLAELTGLHIISGTGFSREPRHPEYVRQCSVDELSQIMIQEIDEVVEGGDFRAGLMGEIGTTEFGLTEQEEKVLRASARAHLATGAAISVHTMSGAEALRVIDILQNEGVGPQRIIIDHVDHDHPEHLRMVAERGVFLGFDCVGKTRYRDDSVRLELLCAMVEAGYEDQIVLSHDISKADYLCAFGGHGYGHLLGTFVPHLSQRLPKKSIEKFLIYNPRRVLSF